MSTDTPAPIVVLNGASSSGKSTLVRAIQDVAADPWLDLGLDRIIWGLPRRYREQPLWDEILGRNIRSGPTGDRMVRAMHAAIAAAARSGLPVVADHVLIERAWADDLRDSVAGLRAILVGLHCPLDVLEARERERRDRTLGQAREQHDAVHAHVSYDLEIDTSRTSPAEAARTILEHVTTRGPYLVNGRPA